MHLFELKKRLEEHYEQLSTAVHSNQNTLGELLENKEQILPHFEQLQETILIFKKCVSEDRSLRHGNVLGALDQAQLLVADGKGSLEKTKSTLELLGEEKTLNDFQIQFATFKNDQETLLKFLQTETHPS